MQPLGLKPFASPPATRQQLTVQDRPQGRSAVPRDVQPAEREKRRGDDLQRRQTQRGDPLRRQQDLFERAATIKLPVVQNFPARGAPTQIRPQAPAQRQAPKAAKRPEATMLLQARDVQPSAPSKPAAAASKAPAQAPAPAAATAPRPGDGARRRGAELAGRMAGAASRALDGLELSAQLRRVQKPSALWSAAARTLGAAGDAMRGAAARWGRYAQGVQTAQQFAEGGGKLALPKNGLDAAGRANGAADWRRAGTAFATSNNMVRSLSVADDDGARKAASQLLPILFDHARSNPTNTDAHRALRDVANAASALGAAREPADAALAARSLRAAGKQVQQLFVERGGGASSVSSDQAATLQRLATVVRGGDEAGDAFRRGSHRSLAAIGAELASALSQGGDGQAAQALALRDRTHELLSAQAGGGEVDTASAAKRLHVAIRQAQAGAQWERERLLQTLDRPAARAA